MGKGALPEGNRMKVVTDGTWKRDDARLAPTSSDARLLAEIGRGLRSVYDEFVHEPVPQHMAALIAKLEYGDRQS